MQQQQQKPLCSGGGGNWSRAGSTRFTQQLHNKNRTIFEDLGPIFANPTTPHLPRDLYGSPCSEIPSEFSLVPLEIPLQFSLFHFTSFYFVVVVVQHCSSSSSGGGSSSSSSAVSLSAAVADAAAAATAA